MSTDTIYSDKAIDTMNTIQSIGYNIYFEDTLNELVKFIDGGKYSKFFILTDENTGEHCLPLVKEAIGDRAFDIIEINAGEESKDIDFCIGVWKTLIDFVHVPTTLLSQVDASVGGKTGIDIDSIKNIIGTFTQPKAVFIDYTFLKTLPARQILSGTAEMLKHGLICDADYWTLLKNSDLSQPTAEMVHVSVQIKNKVVLADPHEKNIRKSLNFGHTVGHAVETYSLVNDEDPLSHGEAIAIGMICEAYLSHKKANLRAAELAEITQILNNLYPRYELKESYNDELYKIMLKDKKNQNGKINCTLLDAIGQFKIDNNCTQDELFESLAYYAGL